MKRFLTFFLVLVAGVVTAGQPVAARADVLSTPVTQLAGSAAVIDDTAGPVDYGVAVPSTNDQLADFNIGDNRQGYGLANCWEKATEDEILLQNPGWFRNVYTAESGGTGLVQLYHIGSPLPPIRVAASNNTWWGDPNTAYDGANGNIVGGMLEKAMAFHISPTNSILDLDWNFPSVAMDAYGLTVDAALPRNVDAIGAAFDAGDVVVIDTGFLDTPGPDGIPARHSVYVSQYDPATERLLVSNPWGSGYAGYPKDVWVDNLWLSTYASVAQRGTFPGASPVAAPEPRYVFPVAAAGLLGRRKRAA